MNEPRAEGNADSRSNKPSAVQPFWIALGKKRVHHLKKKHQSGQVGEVNNYNGHISYSRLRHREITALCKDTHVLCQRQGEHGDMENRQIKHFIYSWSTKTLHTPCRICKMHAIVYLVLTFIIYFTLNMFTCSPLEKIIVEFIKMTRFKSFHPLDS